ncbi:MAG: RES family NAD+ phosphorylase [Gammaproteobacteria bacterium]|nr:RES family NAD+ phosphorylase [Gammaproteobacteria bacterium]MYD20278.1 RES family NAD+ phosphorylase [Rhodothermaceae bacterium]MYG11372.1 RES family NAD+ phosphorylase [Gammaproteobacteria bacterium]MYK28889.1 RES family NAD+ phosphorylase [Gammaproteobacteria bacterium]
MSGFKSPWDYQRFATAVRNERRFFQTSPVRAFLEAVHRGSVDRRVDLPAGKVFSRAQTGFAERNRRDDEGREWIEEVPFRPERMIPPSRNVPEGRINPRGIPYLYLATDDKTAISEVRPSVGTPVSVAKFRTSRQLTLVDLSGATRRDDPPATGLDWLLSVAYRMDQLSQEEIDRYVWAQIDFAFSKPVDSNDEYLNYVPTQVIAESLAEDGNDGVFYGSGLNLKGYNLALFDIHSAEFLNAQLFRVVRVDYDINDMGNPWFLKDGKYFTHEITKIFPADADAPTKE